jgi:hypothetical protein
VDQRAARTFDVAGQADARLVELLRELNAAETSESTGTRSRLMRRAVKQLEQRHGAGVVPVPGKTAFYALIDRLAVGKHTFGSAATRRQLANRPAGAFTATAATRPGQQVQIDSNPIDALVLAADGVPVRADLTIAVDVATRTICAAVLRPVGTKAVDASLPLAKMLVPSPCGPAGPRAYGCRRPGCVRLIFFNDPTLIAEGLTTRYDNHDNHLHVRYCEPVHPNSLYTC